MTVCNSNYSYLIWDFNSSSIFKFDQQWNKTSTINFNGIQPNTIFSVDYNNTKLIFVGTYYHGISSVNANFIILKTYQIFSSVNSIYYNNLTDNLLVTTSTTNGIIILTLDLSFISYYFFTNATTTSMTGCDGLVFVSTTNGIIWVLQNQTLAYTFQTSCTSIKKLKTDQFGYIAVICSTNIIYLYFINGTYSGVSWTSPFASTSDIGFDASVNLVIVTFNTTYLYH